MKSQKRESGETNAVENLFRPLCSTTAKGNYDSVLTAHSVCNCLRAMNDAPFFIYARHLSNREPAISIIS